MFQEGFLLNHLITKFYFYIIFGCLSNWMGNNVPAVILITQCCDHVAWQEVYKEATDSILLIR